MNRRDFFTAVGAAAVLGTLTPLTPTAGAQTPPSPKMARQLKQIQKLMGFDDAQFNNFLSQPRTQKILKRLAALKQTRVVFEVVQAEGCLAGQRIGDRFVFPTGGYLDPSDSAHRLCPFLMPPITRMMAIIQERVWEGLEPLPLFATGQCDDVGLACGGWGKVLIQAKIEESK